METHTEAHTEVQRKAESERHINAMHRLGRIGVAGGILVMLGMPTVLGLYFDAMPTVGQVLQAVLPLLIIFLPSNVSEVIYYTPIMGSSVYLSFITGEIINLKLPVASNALKIMNAEAGTEEADIISAIAVGTASLVTMALVLICVLLVMPLQAVLSQPALKIVSANVLPALFGALIIGVLGNELGGGIRVSGRLKGAVLPVILVGLIMMFDPLLSRWLHLDTLLRQEGKGVIMAAYQGFVIIAMLPVTYFGSKWLYRKGWIRVYLPGEKAKK